MTSSPSPDDLIPAAYSPEVFARAATDWQVLLSEHLQRVTSGSSPVLNWADPAAAIAAAGAWLDRASAGSVASDTDSCSAVNNTRDRIREIIAGMLSAGQNLHHPHYIGHQVPASVPLAGLFDAVSTVTNQVMAIYEMGPWATAVEHALVGRLCEKAGWAADRSSGLLTSGGSLANLTALLTARNVSLPGSWKPASPQERRSWRIRTCTIASRAQPEFWGLGLLLLSAFHSTPSVGWMWTSWIRCCCDCGLRVAG
jgi:L-2,4-diaminobutyrate decarboxylase